MLCIVLRTPHAFRPVPGQARYDSTVTYNLQRTSTIRTVSIALCDVFQLVFRKEDLVSSLDLVRDGTCVSVVGWERASHPFRPSRIALNVWARRSSSHYCTTYSYKWALVEYCNSTALYQSGTRTRTRTPSPNAPNHPHPHIYTSMSPSKMECHESQGLDGVFLYGWLAAVSRQ